MDNHDPYDDPIDWHTASGAEFGTAAGAFLIVVVAVLTGFAWLIECSTSEGGDPLSRAPGRRLIQSSRLQAGNPTPPAFGEGGRWLLTFSILAV